MKAGNWTARWTVLLLFGAAASLPMAASGADRKVTIKNTAFNPRNVSVAVGETVVWTNEDETEHTVTSSVFDSHPNCPGVAGVLRDCMDEDETFQHTFDQPGELSYRCKLHPSMTGVVTVAAAEVTTTTVATTATTQAPTTSSTAATTTTTRKLATSSTVPSSTTSTTVPAESSTTEVTNEAPAFDPDDEGGDSGTAAPASSGGGGGSGTVALIVAALLAVAGGGGVLLWRLRPRPSGGPPAG